MQRTIAQVLTFGEGKYKEKNRVTRVVIKEIITPLHEDQEARNYIRSRSHSNPIVLALSCLRLSNQNEFTYLNTIMRKQYTVPLERYINILKVVWSLGGMIAEHLIVRYSVVSSCLHLY